MAYYGRGSVDVAQRRAMDSPRSFFAPAPMETKERRPLPLTDAERCRSVRAGAAKPNEREADAETGFCYLFVDNFCYVFCFLNVYLYIHPHALCLIWKREGSLGLLFVYSRRTHLLVVYR